MYKLILKIYKLWHKNTNYFQERRLPLKGGGEPSTNRGETLQIKRETYLNYKKDKLSIEMYKLSLKIYKLCTKNTNYFQARRHARKWGEGIYK